MSEGLGYQTYSKNSALTQSLHTLIFNVILHKLRIC